MKLPPKPEWTSSRRDIDEAEENVVRCLEALDQRGEEGLQAELDRIYPGTSRSPLVSEELVGATGIKMHGTRLRRPDEL